MDKPILTEVFRHSEETREGKYLVQRRDGTIPKWPWFVLGAGDPHAEVALRAYADSIEKDPDCAPTLPASLRRLADEFRDWRAANGPTDPTRGKHRVDDPKIIAMMRKGSGA